MKPHWNDPPQPLDRSVRNTTENDAQAIVIGVLIASFAIGAIPILHSSNLALSPESSLTVPGEATLWSEGLQD
ncbi:hypothetical protein CKA32_006855 [Geitlerinema sp. FC II]|uniref:hypothetical protein n=1 Tax=Baaleninema simplex TaxID=2862350 RepID=UPI0003461E2E|nr:hypothetical protein [Baaleninema simplex]MDC0834884.1 hypothetical protein [Geitlerinema sp. CS-897]PPT05541.1 hypothetical protein CKA32_006855 [Geitlerinema sp. FC II]